MSTGRNTARRDTHRHVIAKNEPPCHWCGNPIDYTLGHRDPQSFQIDHVTPLAAGGSDTLDNLVAAHRTCNRTKGTALAYKPGVTYVTDRCWWTNRANPRGSTPTPHPRAHPQA